MARPGLGADGFRLHNTPAQKSMEITWLWTRKCNHCARMVLIQGMMYFFVLGSEAAMH